MRWIVVWLLLAVAGAWWGARRLDVDVDILALLPPEVREVQGLKLLRKHFEAQNNLLILIEAADGAQAEAVVKKLQADPRYQALVRESRALSGMTDADQAGALLAWVLQNAPAERLRALVGRMRGPALQAHLERVLETLASSPDIATVQRWSYDPLGLSEALGADDLSRAFDAEAVAAMESTRLLKVLPATPVPGYKEAIAWLAQVRPLIDAAVAASPGARAGVTGEIVFMAEAGGGMERDLSTTISWSMGLIALLFWVMYRRLRPLLWIMLMLLIVLGVTVGLGTLLLGRINAMNLGFAAIVLGLVVDYGVIIYQESAGLAVGDVAGLRARVQRSILGAAASTAAVFLLLCLSHFTGLRELGLLVGLGIIVGAVAMVSCFPAVVMNWPLQEMQHPARPLDGNAAGRALALRRWLPTLLVLGLITVTLAWKGFPAFDGTSAPMRPKQSEAMATLTRLEKLGMGGDEKRAPLIAVGQSPSALREEVAASMKAAGSSNWLPLAFLPDEAAQTANRSLIGEFIAARDEAARLIEEAGFAPDSLMLLDAVTGSLRKSATLPLPLLPAVTPAADILQRFISIREGETALLGWMDSRQPLSGDSFYSPTWATLGTAISRIAIRDALTKMLPLSLVFLVLLYFVLRSARDTLLALAAMVVGFLSLFALMALLGQQWNLMSIAALPLLIGTAEDYSIHMLLALQHHKGNIATARATTGRAIVFCALSSCIGFGSLTFASNGGIASLGTACALGLAAMMVIAVVLLPQWRPARTAGG